MTTSYIEGAVTVENGSRTVTGDGTGWLTANISPGFFGLDSDDGSPVPVETIVSDTELTLFTPWRGPSVSGSGYWLSYDTRDGQQTVNNAIRLSDYIARLDSASLSSIAGLTPEDQKLILFTGPNTAVLIGRDELGFTYDEQVADLAARAQYDGRPKDFRVLVVDAGDGRSAFYIKNSNTSGDWSDALYVTGAKGDTGEAGPFTQIVGGNTTTLPAGSQATVTPREVSPGVIALDFGVPKGADGTGTGDVVGPDSSVAGNVAIFGDTTGNLLADSGLLAVRLPQRVRVRLFTSSGTYIPDPNMAFAVINCWGAGGGGGGAALTASGTINGGGGGGGGGKSTKVVIRADVGASQTVTVGAGGAGGVAGANTGGAGSSTSVGALCVANGGAGGAGAASQGSGVGGAGGTVGTGDITLPGCSGIVGSRFSNTSAVVYGRFGGDAIEGVGFGGALVAGSNGGAATGYSAGGGGASDYSAQSARAGGNGAPGLCVIIEYCGVTP